MNYKKMLTILIILIFTLVIITIVVLWYLNFKENQIIIDKTNQNTNTETEEIDTSYLPSKDLSMEGWKIYRNKNIGVEFRYPSSWSDLELTNISGVKMQVDEDFCGSFMIGYLPDESNSINNTFLDYCSTSIDIQYEKIKCKNSVLDIECIENISSNEMKYVWRISKTKGGLSYHALVPTGRHILVFDFGEKENYEKRRDEYQGLLNSLRIVE